MLRSMWAIEERKHRAQQEKKKQNWYTRGAEGWWVVVEMERRMGEKPRNNLLFVFGGGREGGREGGLGSGEEGRNHAICEKKEKGEG